jgi:hypothetical protein
MAAEKLDLTHPVPFTTSQEREAAVAFFNAAFRAEESGLRQAHELAHEVEKDDPELSECLRLYGDEEGWHRELLTQFLAWLGGEVRPMGPTTTTFYRLYARAKSMESIVLVNLMFETIGSTTYRLALRRITHPGIRQMLTILTRDESFHVPLNVHFLRCALERAKARQSRSDMRSATVISRARLRAIYHTTFLALVASTAASRRRAQQFDGIPVQVLGRAYAEELARLFLEEEDLGLAPSPLLLRGFRLDRAKLLRQESPVSLEAAERSAEREDVVVEAR